VIIEVDPKNFRSTEATILIGGATKAREKLGWGPTATFKELVRSMIEYDLKLLFKGKNKEQWVKE